MLLAVEASSDERGVSATVKGARTLANAHNSAIKVFSLSLCWQPCRTVLDDIMMTIGGLHPLWLKHQEKLSSGVGVLDASAVQVGFGCAYSGHRSKSAQSPERVTNLHHLSMPMSDR